MKLPLFPSDTDQEYRRRINHVFQYIEDHLDGDLSLAILSDIAYFSPFHFHRIFKMIAHETLNAYVTRKRVERAASDLLHKPGMSVTDVSYQHGFTNNASFTRAFRKFYGTSPTVFRQQNAYRIGRITPPNSKIGQELPGLEDYICMLNTLKSWMNMHAKIEIKETPVLHVAYVSCIGPKQLPNAYQQLMQWAVPKGLFHSDARLLTLYHDSFKITAYDKVRLSACLTVDKEVATEGAIGITTIQAGKYLVGRYEIGHEDFTSAWTGLYVWLKENGYTKREGHPFEIYHNNFEEHPEKKSIVDFYVPVT